MKVKYMKNAKNKIENNANIESTKIEKIMTIADVARELNIDPKRARAFLRKNVELYTMRKQKFTKSSSLYKNAIDALTQYKNKNVVVTK